MSMPEDEKHPAIARDGPPGTETPADLPDGVGREAADGWAAAVQRKGHRGARGHPEQRVHDLAILDDLDFLKAWEQGRVPFIGAIVRVRQIRRANLAHQARPAS